MADDVAALTLRHPENRPLPEWRPGAHIDLLLDDGLVRTYSLSGTRNTFALRPARRYLFVDGGIGITPILPMVAAAAAAGADWRLLHGGRSHSSMAYLDELAPYGDPVAVRPQDRHGLLDLDAFLGEPDDHTLVHCCGPEPLLAAVERFGAAAGPPGRFRSSGSGRGSSRRRPGTVPSRWSARSPVSPFKWRLGDSVLRAVRAAGVSALSSCAEGIRGTCETEVLEGVPDHRDSVLGDEERASGETMMICVSRARTPRLVLDL